MSTDCTKEGLLHQLADTQQKLLQSQASEARLREALVEANKWMHPRHINSDVEYLAAKDSVKQAISTQPNTSELEAYVDARLELLGWWSQGDNLDESDYYPAADFPSLDTTDCIPLYAKKG